VTKQLQIFLKRAQEFVNSGLDTYLPKETIFPERIHQAMRYSIFAGGKRVRPALTLAAYEFCGGDTSKEPIALACCAIEMLHVFSLIHDDLPSMDNDDFRRGKPTNHRVFGEALAVLGGDALCIHAFELLGRTGNPKVITEVAAALGTDGMIGGQVVDIESEGKKVDIKVLEYIHTRKTGALITTCLKIGALLADAPKDTVAALTEYGKNVGHAFQVADDILDVEGTTEQIGKDAGSDEERGKITYPALLGLNKSKEIAHELIRSAKQALSTYGNKGSLLNDVADYIIDRVN
jgi:geranylgeranyl diphosphate synthase type II